MGNVRHHILGEHLHLLQPFLHRIARDVQYGKCVTRLARQPLRILARTSSAVPVQLSAISFQSGTAL